jgi:hypothetical protein
MEALKKTASSSDLMRRRIIFSLIAAIGAIWISTILLPDNLILNSSASVVITSGLTLAAAILIIARQKSGGLYGKTHIALAIGLACWFAGEMIWTYDNLIAGNEPTQLSLADIPWLALYAFFGYYIFKTYQFFGHAVNRYHLVAVISAVAIVIAYTAYAVLSSLDQIGSPAVVAIRLLYPFGDAVLIVPSVLLLITLRHGLLTYTPWLFASAALILIAAADILFTNISALGAFDLLTMAFPLYNAGNLTFAGALLWYNKFGIYDHIKATGSFQERNR